MDDFAIDLHSVPRLNRLVPPIHFIGAEKNDVNRKACRRETVNIGLILSAKFETACYLRDGAPRRARIPACAFIVPGPVYQQNNPGPCEKIFFSYRKEHLDHFSWFLAPGRDMVEIPSDERIWEFLRSIRALIPCVYRRGTADLIDLYAAGILQAVAAGSGENSECAPHAGDLRAVAAWLDIHYQENPDWNELAARHGMSPRTFQRGWKKMFGIPPGRYLMKKRLAEICRLLRERDYTIRRTAEMTGFRDPAYLSRFFHMMTGMTPGEFRRKRTLLPPQSR